MAEVSIAYKISSGILFLAWGVILTHGLRSGRARTYPVFYLFTLSAVGALSAKLAGASIFGLDSPIYPQIFFWADIPALILATALLWRILRLTGSNPRSIWLLTPLVSLFVLESVLLDSRSLGTYQISSAIFCFQATLCGFVLFRLIRTPQLALGRNQSTILAGLFLPLSFVWSNNVAYLFGVSWWPFDFFGYSTEPVIIFGWLLMAWGMWKDDPPRYLNTGGRDEGDLRRDLGRISRSFKEMRNHL